MKIRAATLLNNQPAVQVGITVPDSGCDGCKAKYLGFQFPDSVIRPEKPGV